MREVRYDLVALLVSVVLALIACGDELPDASLGEPASGPAGGAAAIAGGVGDTPRPPRVGAAGMGAVSNSGQGGQGGDAGAGAGEPAGTSEIRIWIAGDSTVANGTAPCPIGWGAHFQELFDARVTVVNRAVGGRSVRTWLYDVLSTMDARGECELRRDGSGAPTLQAHWQEMLDGMQRGDYLLIQFGINDSASTCDRHVGVDAFEESYGYMAKAASDRGAHPIFITPVSSIACNGDSLRPSRAPYDAATKDAGMLNSVPVIDLEAASVALYDERKFCPISGGDVSAATTGPVGDFFCNDHTHFSTTGARAIAALVADGIRDQAAALAAYLLP